MVNRYLKSVFLILFAGISLTGCKKDPPEITDYENQFLGTWHLTRLKSDLVITNYNASSFAYPQACLRTFTDTKSTSNPGYFLLQGKIHTCDPDESQNWKASDSKLHVRYPNGPSENIFDVHHISSDSMILTGLGNKYHYSKSPGFQTCRFEYRVTMNNVPPVGALQVTYTANDGSSVTEPLNTNYWSKPVTPDTTAGAASISFNYNLKVEPVPGYIYTSNSNYLESCNLRIYDENGDYMNGTSASICIQGDNSTIPCENSSLQTWFHCNVFY